MKKVVLLFVYAVFSSVYLMAQSFEGVITFKRFTQKDTVEYIYSVKNQMVRIDEKNKKGKIQGTMLVDLKEKKITTISHDRKIYMNVETRPASLDMSKTNVEKTTETKQILGQTCEKWVVTNTEHDTQAEFWVHNGKYDFFIPLLEILKRKDKISLLYLQIPEAAGYFSLIGEERDNKGNIREKLEVMKIEKKKLLDASFKVPPGYSLFDSK